MSSQKDWQRLAEYAARRRAELGLTQIEVAQRGPLSLDRVQAIEGAKRTRYRLATLVALERALAWEPGSVERILVGGEPTPLPPSARIYQAYLTTPAPEREPAKPPARRISDEEIINSGLSPETVQALLRMRRRIDRLVAQRREKEIRQMDHVTEIWDDEADAS